MTNAGYNVDQATPEWFEELGKPPHYVLPTLEHCQRLTRRENEAAILFAQGLRHSEVATRMGIGRAAAEDHAKAIYRKWKITDKADLVKYAIAFNLVSLPKEDRLVQLIEGYNTLNAEEKKTLYWTSKGLSCREIKENLGLSSEEIARERRRSICRKLRIAGEHGFNAIATLTLAYLALKFEAHRLYFYKHGLHSSQRFLFADPVTAATIGDLVNTPNPDRDSPKFTISEAKSFPIADTAPGKTGFVHRFESPARVRTAFRG